MGRISKSASVLALITILTAPAIVGAADLSLASLTGTWHNTDPNTGGIVTIIMADAGGIQIQAYGACSPDPCDWGFINGTAYGRNKSSFRATTFLANYSTDYGESVMTGSLAGAYLRVEIFTKAVGGQSDTVWTGVFARE